VEGETAEPFCPKDETKIGPANSPQVDPDILIPYLWFNLNDKPPQ